MSVLDIDDLKDKLDNLRRAQWYDRALVVERIHNCIPRPTIRRTAKALGLSIGYISEELKICKYCRLYPELATLIDRQLILRAIRKKRK